MSHAATLEVTAVQYVENQMYDNADADAKQTTDTDQGTRIGLEVTRRDESVEGAAMGLLFGLLGAVLVAFLFAILLPQLIVPGGIAVAAAGAYLGYNRSKTEYATVTIDSSGDIVLWNRDLSSGDYARLMDLDVTAAGEEAHAEASGRQRARTQEAITKDLLGGFFGWSGSEADGYSTPNMCPDCGASHSLLAPQFEELSAGQYQCVDCGEIIDLHDSG